jgi:hypothetical protein
MITAVPFVTAHATAGFQDRVNSCVSRQEVPEAIRETLARADRRSQPRHWTKVDARPGCRYLYLAAHPDICLVLRGGAVATVPSRASCSAWYPSPDGAEAARPLVPYRHRRVGITELCEPA